MLKYIGNLAYNGGIEVLRFKKNLEFIIFSITYYPIVVFLRLLPRSVYFQFDTELLKDGIGAQLHRKISVLVAAENLNCGFIDSPFLYFEPHPIQYGDITFDPSAVLSKINGLFDFDLNLNLSERKIKYLSYPEGISIFRILLLKFTTIIHRSLIVVKLSDMHNVLQLYPNWYQSNNCRLNELRNKLSSIDTTHVSRNYICIHYRQSIGNMFIHPGQNVPRQIAFERIVNLFIKNFDTLNVSHTKVYILTDAPIQDKKVKIPRAEKRNFFETFGIIADELNLPSFDFKSHLSSLKIDFEIIFDSDPIILLSLLNSASVIVGSKSSLSFFASVINNSAKIFMPKDFWHNLPNSWNKY